MKARIRMWFLRIMALETAMIFFFGIGFVASGRSILGLALIIPGLLIIAVIGHFAEKTRNELPTKCVICGEEIKE